MIPLALFVAVIILIVLGLLKIGRDQEAVGDEFERIDNEMKQNEK
jgi:Tfp pilus assembly protein PilX